MLFHSTKKPTQLQIIHLNKKQESLQKQIKDLQKDANKPKCTFAQACQLFKKIDKKKPQDTTEKQQNSVYVLDFDGDIKASAVAHLREEISAIISVAKEGDQVVLRLESGGGQVNAYGLAAAQLQRLKDAKLHLTVCVDKIAASGGYMMACVADKIIASDFGVLGSIGVVSQLPNFHDFLKNHHINFEQFTAGEYKRTVTMFGENTDEDRAKHQEDLERIHELFKNHVAKYRPQLNLEQVATGEIWFGLDAITLGLVDEIGTSDAYLLHLMNNHNVFALHSRSKPTLAEKLGLADQVTASLSHAVGQGLQKVSESLAKLNRP